MKFFKPLIVPCILAPVLAINACKKLPQGEIKPKNSDTVAAVQDTSYTDLEYGIHIFKVNHSDILPIGVHVEIINKLGYHLLLRYDISEYKEDYLKFNGGSDFISKDNFAQNHSDTSLTFIAKQADRLKIQDLYLHSIHALKPADEKTDLTVEWTNNDITEAYDAEKERQRTNATISAITKGEVVFWQPHP